MGKGKSPRGGSGAPYMLDRSLISRIEQLSSRTDVTDIDGVVEHLRRIHKEYQRKQVAALRQMVTRAVQVLRDRGSLPELQLQVREALRPTRK
jgi:predicted lipid-binding transport protein (Tim44 family)